MRDIPVRFYDIDKGNILRCLFCGLPGSGKTWLAGTFPKPFFIDLDGGGKTLAHLGIPFISYNIHDLRMTDVKERPQVFVEITYIIEQMMKNKGRIWIKRPKTKEETVYLKFVPTEGYEPYDAGTIVVDSVSKLGEILYAEAMLDPRVGATEKGGTSHSGKKDPMYEAGGAFADFGVLGNRIIEIFDMFKDFPGNVVATAGIDSSFGEGGSVVYSNLPDILGRFRKRAPHDFDIVAVMEKDRSKPDTWHMRTTSHAFQVKTRGKLSDDIVNPTYEKIIEEIARYKKS